MIFSRTAAIFCVAFVGAVCRPSAADQSAVPERRSGYGTACLVNGRTGRPSYLVRELGRQGTPALSAAEAEMLRKIMRYVHPSTLRVAFIGTARTMIVFDAIYGPCYAGAPGYFVLNGACNDFYSPVEGGGVVPQCWLAPRPWIPHDRGDATAPSWSLYPNGH